MKKTYHITTLGCQMNAHDSEKLAGILEARGFAYEPMEEQAGVVVYNTCCIRENAEQKVFGRLGYLKHYKQKNPEMLIALCGCMMQEAHVLEKLKKSYRFVDLIFGTHNLYRFSELLDQAMVSDKTVVEVWDHEGPIVENLPTKREVSFKASVNIMYGCNNFCTYCIVPYVRGRERSREPEDILKEVQERVAAGAKEIQLLGQNVNSYGKTLAQPISFAELLRRVSEVEGLERIRFMTSHPKDLSDELIAAMGTTAKVCPQFHLPLQSGSDRILQAMNRHYTRERYFEQLRKLRKAVPNMAVTTDIIVGFPGETEEDFQDTLRMVEQCEFDGAFTFLYSRRVGTPAATMPDQVPDDVAKARFDRLITTLKQTIDKRNDPMIGQVVNVLVEAENDHEEGCVTGRDEGFRLVHFAGDKRLIGTTVQVRLDAHYTFYFSGHQV